MNLDSPAGEAMVAEASRTLTGVRFPQTMQENEAIRMVGDIEGRMILSAALSATVECAVCGGSGHMMCEAAAGEPLPPGLPCGGCCYRCDGTGRRLAWKELTDE